MGEVIPFRPRRKAAAPDLVVPMLVAPIAVAIACTAIFTALWLRRW